MGKRLLYTFLFATPAALGLALYLYLADREAGDEDEPADTGPRVTQETVEDHPYPPPPRPERDVARTAPVLPPPAPRQTEEREERPVGIPNLETQVRQAVTGYAGRFVGFVEEGRDNYDAGGLIETFLRSSEYTGALRGRAAPAGSSWCAGFASHVLQQTVPDTLSYRVVAKNLLNEMKREGAYYGLGSGYRPRPGDLVFFERGEDGDWRGHVGFVESVGPDGTLHTIEGNKAHPDFQDREEGYIWQAGKPDGVRKASYRPGEFQDKRILGFGDIYGMYVLRHGEKELSQQPEGAGPKPGL